MRKRAPKAVDDYDAYFQINSSDHSDHMHHHETPSVHHITVAPPQRRQVESSHIIRIPPPLPSPTLDEWSDFVGTSDVPEEFDIESKGEKDEDVLCDDISSKESNKSKEIDETCIRCSDVVIEAVTTKASEEPSAGENDVSTFEVKSRSEVGGSVGRDNLCEVEERIFADEGSGGVDDTRIEAAASSDENMELSPSLDGSRNSSEEISDAKAKDIPNDSFDQERPSLTLKQTVESNDEKFYFSSRDLHGQFIRRSCSSDVDLPYDASFEEKE